MPNILNTTLCATSSFTTNASIYLHSESTSYLEAIGNHFFEPQT